MDNKHEPLPERKVIRLKDYDYSQNGAYFVTICTNNRAPYFGALSSPSSNVGADSISARIIKEVFAKTIAHYPAVECPIFKVMPDHFHAIIVIERADMESAPTLSDVMQCFKRWSTIEYTKAVKDNLVPPYDKKLWQRGFYDHVIRNEADYLECMEYIEQNPLKAHLLKQKDL